MGLEQLDDRTLELLFQRSIENAGDLIEVIKTDCQRHDWAISSDNVEVNGEETPTLEVIAEDWGDTELNPPPIGAVRYLTKFGFLGEFKEKARYGENGRRVVVEAPISLEQHYR